MRVNTKWIMAPHLEIIYDNETDNYVDNKPFIVVMEDGTKLYLMDVIILCQVSMACTTKEVAGCGGNVGSAWMETEGEILIKE